MTTSIADRQASAQPAEDEQRLERIEAQDAALTDRFRRALAVDENLTRGLVSFQANKLRTHYKWYKYKEAFSASLVEYLFHKRPVREGRILDPFAGAGTALFAAAALGYDATGIELLPIGQKIIEANLIARGKSRQRAAATLDSWCATRPWQSPGEQAGFEVLRITDGAYPQETHGKIGRYLACLESEPEEAKELLLFALLCVLESVSYTRKDGQYLRWDARSGRCWGKNPFSKGVIAPFDLAISQKLAEISVDIQGGAQEGDLLSNPLDAAEQGEVSLLKGSCLDLLPQVSSGSFTGIITSPPYCNRYDYTRTYALELALLGVSEVQLARLRQEMLSCTVENRTKELLAFNPAWQQAINACDRLPLLQEVLGYLDYKRARKELNNNGIARMVRNYFYEMACVLQECHRVLAPNGLLMMVNDNVRYAGVPVSVDLILSGIAECLGYEVESILVLPQRKGNSSQQMGRHGREALRKCVYVWRRA